MRGLRNIWILGILLSGSCQKQPANHPPVINSIVLEPGRNFTPGSDIKVTIDVEDSDQDELQFLWEAEGGVLSTPDQRSTNWELDTGAEPSSYESISVTVSDGKSVVSETHTIQVSEGLLMTGIATYSGTSIPVPGVEISIGKFTTVTDKNGRYLIEHLKEGSTLVIAKKQGFDPFEAEVYVDNPKSVFHISMTSPIHTGKVLGIIKTIDDVIYEGLKVVLLNPDESESELYGYTNGDGEFVLEDVPLGLRNLMIQSKGNESHFLNDSMIYEINMNNSGISYNARIKIRRTILSDVYLSESDKWESQGLKSDGFHILKKGQHMVLREFISVPADAEKAMFFLDSYVIGGCDLVGRLPSHRVWVSNVEREYLGGISWGGEGSNYTARVSWFLSDIPTFMDVYGKQIKLHLEIYEENSCIPDPLWRLYQLEFSYYY